MVSLIFCAYTTAFLARVICMGSLPKSADGFRLVLVNRNGDNSLLRPSVIESFVFLVFSR